MKRIVTASGFCWSLVAALSLAMATNASAQININSSGDVWIREVSPDSTYEGDLISVWSSFTTGNPDAGYRRYGLVEFDLSGLAGKTIVGAKLRLYSLLTGGSSGVDSPIKQTAYVIDSGGTALTSLSWNSYLSEKDATKQALEGLGKYDLPPTSSTPAIQDTYVDSIATPADLALIQSEIDGDGLLSLVLIADEDGNDYRQDWGDADYAGLIPVLVIDDGSGCAITTTTLPDAFEGDPYSATLQQDGTCSNFSWSIVSGALPAGLSLNAATGEISGVPDGVGNYGFTVQVNSDQGARTADLSIRVVPYSGLLTIAASSEIWIREAAPDSTYENDLISVWASNTTGNPDAGYRRYGLVEFDVSSLAGKAINSASLKLYSILGDSSGASNPIKQQAYVIDSSGTPLANLTWNLFQSEKDAGKTALETLGVYDLPDVISTPQIQNTYVPSPASANDLAVLNSEVNGDGLLSLALIAVEDGNDYRQDWGDGAAGGFVPLLEVDDGTRCYIATAMLPEGEVDTPYSEAIQASGACSGTLSWSVESGALPDGLTLDESTGQISGTPTVTGIFKFQVRMDSSDGYFRRAGYVVPVNGGSRGRFVASGDAWIREIAPNASFEDDLISVWSSASNDGGQGPARRVGLVEFNVAPLAGATLKGAWLSLYSYSGTGPIKQSAFEFTTGAPVGGMTWNTFPSATQSGFERFGRYELAAGEGVGAYVDSLPATPADLARIEAAAAGDGVLSLSLVADEDGTEYRRDWGDDGYAGSPPILVLDIGGGCVILTSALPDAEFGLPYSTALTASSACGVPTWEVRNCDLPPGLSLDPNTGVISGRPGLAGLYSFTIGLASLSSEVDLMLEVLPSPADLDKDGDVGPNDLALFNAGFTGPGGCHADAGASDLMTLEAVGDVWVRESAPDNTYEGDMVSVWSSSSGDGARRYGLMEWDVSSLAGQTLASAHLSLWADGVFSGASRPLKQHAFVIDTTGKTPLVNLTWNTLMAEHPGLGTALESLGRFDQQAPNATGTAFTYTDGFEASAADLALIQAAANSPSGRLSIVMVADEDGTDYRRDWGDGTNAGGSGYVEFPGRLVVQVPTTSCWIATNSLPAGAVGVPYSAVLTAGGSCAGTLQWQLAGCLLPPGLSLNASTGEISGVPVLGGHYPIVVQLTSNEGTVSHALNLNISGPDADFDDDGDVDLVDFDFFALRFGGPHVRSFCGTFSFPSTDTPLAVPDAGSVQSVIVVPEGITIGDVDVSLDITHPFAGGVKIELTSPQGTTILLKDFDFDGDAFTARTYDDEGARQPVQSLTAFDGQSTGGTWTLTVYDEDTIVDNGMLNSWSLIITAQ